MSNDTEIPSEEFIKVMKDFVNDIRTTFPEYIPLMNKWWKCDQALGMAEEEQQKAEKETMEVLFLFCRKKYPPRFFDILYQNNDIFAETSTVDTELLPNIYFKNIWNFDISDKTRETIWKYLQLILFSLVGSLKDKDAFGESAKLFEAIHETEFKTKLEETMSKMQEMFESAGVAAPSEEEGDGPSSGTPFGMPDPSKIHEHISGMLGGKLGKLAQEIAEETAGELSIDMEDVTDVKDVFSKLMKNPSKLMGMVKNVGSKLDERIKSGEIKESELIAEATELMNKMKNTPGMGDIQSLLSKMNLGGLGKGQKVNVAAMEAQLNRNMKQAQMKERIRGKMEANRLAKAAAAAAPVSAPAYKQALSEEELIQIFSTGEKVEKTPRRKNGGTNTAIPAPAVDSEPSQTEGSAKKKKKPSSKK